MRNLQYEMKICQKSHNKITKTVDLWFEFLWIRRYIKCKITRPISIMTSAYTKGQIISKANYGFLNSPKKQTKLTIPSKEHPQDSEFRSFFFGKVRKQ